MMIPISARARLSGRLHVFDLDEPVTMEHELTMPPAMCPRSGNPVQGVIHLAYTSSVVVEVVSLYRLVQHAQHEAPNTYEGWCAYVARTVAASVGATVQYRGEATVNPGMQVLRVASCVSI